MDAYTLSEPQKPAETPSESSGSKPQKKFIKPLIIAGVVLGFLIMFALGSLLGGSRATPQPVDAIPPTPTKPPVRTTPRPSEIPPEVNSSIQYLPGKQYLDDSIAIISKAEPKRALLISLSRFELTKNYTQYVKVNYYNGTEWLRETITTTTPTAQIVSNPLLNEWNIQRQTAAGSRDTLQVTMQNKPVEFIFTSLSPDTVQKSLPGLTKFNAFGTGTLRIGDETIDAYVIYTTSYARSAADMAFLSTPERVSSTWMAFWDTNGNAYLADSFTADTGGKLNGTSGLLYNQIGTYKTLGINFRRLPQADQYSVSFTNNPPILIQFALTAPLLKSNSKTFLWRSAITSGKVTVENKETPGVGIFEGIEQLSR